MHGQQNIEFREFLRTLNPFMFRTLLVLHQGVCNVLQMVNLFSLLGISEFYVVHSVH